MIAGRENSYQNRHSTISESRQASGGPVSYSVVFLLGEPILNVNSLRSHKAKFAHETLQQLTLHLARPTNGSDCYQESLFDLPSILSASLSSPSSQFKAYHRYYYVGLVDFEGNGCSFC